MLCVIPKTLPENYTTFYYGGGKICAALDYKGLLDFNSIFEQERMPIRFGPAIDEKGRFMLNHDYFQCGLYLTRDKLKQLQREPNGVSLRDALNRLEKELLGV